MTDVPPGLAEWAALAGPAKVLAEVRRRAAQGSATERGILTLRLSDQERTQAGKLLGLDWELSAGRKVRLQDLAAALAQHGLTVRGFVEALDDRPLVNLRQMRADNEASATAAVAAERSAAASSLRRSGVPSAVAVRWLDDGGLPRGGDGELRSLVADVLRVRRDLPGPGSSQPLAQLAARVSKGNAHALDADTPLGRATARLIAAEHGLPRPIRANREWRSAWAAAGVACDGVSSRVLVLNLPLSGDAPAVGLAAATPGEPVWLTLRSLSGEWTAAASTTVFVCENVTVLEAAADRHGVSAAPIIATDGVPSNTALDLIMGLATAGCPLRIRADFDRVGLSIVDQLRAVAPSATGWRFDAAAYLAVVRGTSTAGGGVAGGDALAELSIVHGRIGEDIHEEAIMEDLLADLTAAQGLR